MATVGGETQVKGGEDTSDTATTSDGSAGTQSYAAALQSRLAHAPTKATPQENKEVAERLLRQDRVEPELMAALGRFSKIHPTRATPGESLPEGLQRSSTGFLIKTSAQQVRLSKEKIQKEMEHFQSKVIIAYFVGGRISSRASSDWAKALSTEIKEACTIGRDLGSGFFQITTNGATATQKILMLTPHLSQWGTCIMQPWIPGFNATRPTGMKMPVWITLKAVPDEFLSSSEDLAQSLGVVLGRHKGNAYTTDQRF